MNAVTDSIMSHTSDPNVRAAMLMGAFLESGANANSVGDQGTSFGPFQIHLPAHPGVTAQQAQDPQFAVAFMLPAYQNGVSQVPSSLWQTNPALAAATAAFKAERPLNMYAASSYNANWSKVIAVLGGNTTLGGGGTGSVAPPTTGGAATDTASVSGTIVQSFYPVLNAIWMAGLIAGGIAIVGVGVYLLVTGTVPTTPTINVKVEQPKETRRESNPTPTGSRTPKVYRKARPANSTNPLPARAVRTTPRTAVAATAGKPSPPKPIVIDAPKGISS